MTDRKKFNGIYASLIVEYVKFKQAQGFKFEGIERCLERFDKFASDRGGETIGISKDLADAWSAPFPLESEKSRYCRISLLRGFSAYLQTLGYTSYIPVIPKLQNHFIPHIYTNQELYAIFRECDKLTLDKHFLHSSKCVIPTLIRVLYGTGIRISEAIKLIHSDVDFDKGLIKLRESKNGQDRIVPMSLSLREVCKDWVAYKQKMGIPVDADSPLFTAADGHRISHSTINHIFRTILQRAGIGHGGRGHGPRLHDLRHTFCVNSLVKLSEAGMDLYYSMPILMTYMGHKCLESTNNYVRLTQEMFPHVTIKMDNAYQCIFPEMNSNLIDEEEI